jgi:hypothetical protein
MNELYRFFKSVGPVFSTLIITVARASAVT